ncbi:hypothetical protein [Streptomyces niveus]|uniref:hypothetical protein n=1 Tax=Streptomyces niveus TaxID=193462 RepID=UPI00341CC569
MDTEAASTLLFETLAHAVAGNSEQAATGLQTLGSQSDDNQMYGVCFGLANVGTMMLNRIYGERAPKPENGDMWALHQLKPGAFDADPPQAFASRFLVAHANGDTDTAMALFNAALASEGDQYVDSVCALLADVAGLCRLARDRSSGSAP